MNVLSSINLNMLISAPDNFDYHQYGTEQNET